jgi:hypothetical protein
MSRITEAQLVAFNEEIEKLSSTWYGNAAKAVGRFGQRQLHSLTGWTPKGFGNVHGIEEMGAGASAARKAYAKATGSDKAQALESLLANEKAQEMGLTHLPGAVKAFATKPREALRAAWDQQVRGTSGLEKAVMVGLPAAGLASDVLSEDDGTKGQRIGEGVANTAAGMLTGGMPLAGGLVAGVGAQYLGGKVGKLFDKKPAPQGRVLGPVQAPPNPEDAKGHNMPVEREMSPAAQGRSEVFG